MGEQTPSNTTTQSPKSSTPKSPNPNRAGPPTPPPPPQLIQPPDKKRNKPKVFRIVRSVFRSFPIISPLCKFPGLPAGIPESLNRATSGSKVTGTLYGYRKGKVRLSVQENPKFFPFLIIELPLQTSVLQKELGSGLVRIAMECEKKAEKDKVRLLDETIWNMFCNGKKNGYGVKKEAAEEDLKVMELLRAVSTGIGVLPANPDIDGPDDEYIYIRSNFERIVGSKDSETFYMINPEANSGPELSIFFVRI
ncbi:protein MIZU-KUSSEI 1 [Euphorbia lathyris]|uniref:protein MIZU-KUSSEI 1 n=1 Tax=Euphorbia lathyris TaxID=212925 RepID=UPI003313B02B